MKCYTFIKGENVLDGDDALTFVRERKQFKEGDFHLRAISRPSSAACRTLPRRTCKRRCRLRPRTDGDRCGAAVIHRPFAEAADRQRLCRVACRRGLPKRLAEAASDLEFDAVDRVGFAPFAAVVH